MPDLVTIGETCAVLVAKSGGPLRHAAEFSRHAGGAESTVAVGVARLGYSVGWISRLGADELGIYILGVMRSENVDVEHVRQVEGEQTGIFLRENRANGSSNVFYYRSNSAFTTFSPDDLNEDYIATAQILHLTGITPGLSDICRATVERAFEIAEANGVEVVFDLNYRAKIWPQAEARVCLENLMKRADHVLAGREDLFKLVGVADRDEQLAYLNGLGLSTIVLKTGANGTILADSEGTRHVSSAPVSKTVDRFGVGDAFAAGYIVGQLQGRSNLDAVALGNRVAGWSVQLPGNIESLPNWSELGGMDAGINMADR